ncbi:MAG: phosphate ABC transporter substrate-binding protein PstS [Microbacterium sp.]|uniref:phosphate ABC transporter substrate-binding protein PstS n=1 Tax=unclassified Microbacterium TaxID=2609290 RepID=UPI000DB69912|nr:phosphate ABC transporter substrate-binding protein PstS [Microbacterium sp.]PZU38951.1 MAG: phosphate ABC transporter substrate-binding protein PstS [Microbacterium sp.]
MKITRISRVAALGAVAALALAGCAANEGGTTTEPTEGGSSLSGELVGAGSSAQEVGVQAWSAGFQTVNPDVTISYDPSGSGAGRDSFQAGAVGFAGSDRAFTIDEIAEGPFDACVEGTGIIEIPSYISPIAVIFNLDGIETLNMSPAVVAGIFAGTISNWNDPAIAADNEGVELPDLAITPVHRADDSGTTENFTDYLAQAAPEVWEWEADGEWPATPVTGEAAQGTSGVVAAVEGAPGAVTYADASRAEGFGTVAVRIGDEFVSFTPEAAAAIVDASPREEGRTDGDLAIALDRTPDEAAYPIVLVSYMIACEEYTDAATAPLVKGFLEYVISPEGQDEAAAAAGSAPISETQRENMQAALDLIVVE